MDVQDKVAIVTGASEGIGRATARLLTERGVKVALVARSAEALRRLAAELPGALAAPADMSQPDQIAAMVRAVQAHYGRIDVLVNCAGRGYDAPVERIDAATWHDVFDLDLVGPVVAMQHVIPAMRAGGGGAIVNVSSGTALQYLPNQSPYASLKRALAFVSLTARSELQSDGIVVSVVYPFITDTEFEAHTIQDLGPEPASDDEEGGEDERGGFQLPPADSAAYAAETILRAIVSGAAEVFAHDWMRQRARG